MTFRFLARSRAAILSAVLVSLATFCAPIFVHAQTNSEPIRTEVVIPTSGVEQAVGQAAGTVRDLGQYIGNIYNFLISIVGLVAAVMMIIGGFQYLTAGGDKSRVDAGKKRITNALIGLILAFSSYAILNTINPALLTLKLPGVSNVKTVLSFLPWCEDVEGGGTAVTPVILGVSGTQRCGTVGEYQQSNSKLYCVYRGDRDACQVSVQNSPVQGLPDMKVPTICAPDPNLTADAAATIVADFRKMSITEYHEKYGVYLGSSTPPCPTCAGNIPGGTCASCADAAYYTFTKQGKPVPSGYCAIYQAMANKGNFNSDTFARVSATGQKYVQYCAYDSDVKTCVGAAIFCQDPVPTTGGCYGDEDDHTGYNFAPNLYYTANVDGHQKVGSWIHGGDRMGTVGSHPAHLSNVCSANPCGYNSSGGGCGGETGLVSGIRTVATAALDGIVGIDYCDNK